MTISKIKRGDMHLEMILSFVIFTGFTIFLLAIFNPIKLKNNSNDLEIAEREILKKAMTEVDFLTIKLTNETVAGNCFSFEYGDIEQPKHIIVNKADSANTRVRAKKTENKISILPDDDTQIYFIKAEKEDFVESRINPCSNELSSDNYALGAIMSYNMTSLEKMKILNSNYSSNYNGLKEELGISSDFGFEIENESIKAERQIPQGKKVIAESIPIQLVYSEGIKYRKMIIKVW